MVKVLFVISALEAGGAEKSLINLLKLFDYNRYQVDLLLFKKEGIFMDQIPEEVRIIEAPDDLFYLYNIHGRQIKHVLGAFPSIIARITGTIYRNYFVRNKSYPGTQIRWNKFYKKHISIFNDEYDIAISYMHGEVMYYVAEKIKARKKITWVHNDYRALKLKPETDYPYLCSFDKIATISDECVDILTQVFPQIKDKVVSIPNLTSSSLIRKRAELYYPEEYKDSCNANKVIILSIGRLNYQKGFDIAIKIAAEMKKRGLQFVWYIIGQGTEQEHLTELINQFGLKEEFVLLGIRENPYPYIKNADIIAQPSRYEGKSVVIDEAKILHKPIVVSDYATVRDQITNENEGIISKLEVENFAEALEKLIQSKDLRDNYEEYLNQHEYGNDSMVEMYYKLMEI